MREACYVFNGTTCHKCVLMSIGRFKRMRGGILVTPSSYLYLSLTPSNSP